MAEGLTNWIKGAYDGVAGRIRSGFNAVKATSADAPKSPAAQTPYDPAVNPARAAAAGVRPPADEFTKLYDPARLKAAGYNATPEQAARAAASAAPPRVQGVNPNVRAGVSAEGAAFRASGAGANPTLTGSPGAIRGAPTKVGGVMKALAPLGAVAGVPDQLMSGGATDMDDQMAQRVVGDSNVGRSLLGNAISLSRRTGNALSSVPLSLVGGTDINGNFGDKFWGGVNDVSSGQSLGTTQFGARGAAVNPAAPNGSVEVDPGMGLPPAPPAGTIPTIRGGSVTPEELIEGREVPVEGTGAFKRTTRGNEGAAVGIDTRGAPVQPEGGPYRGRGGFRDGEILGGMMRAKGQQQNQADKMAKAELGVKETNAKTAAAKVGLEARDANRKVVDQAIKDHVARDPDVAGIKDPKEREAALASKQGEVSSRFRYTLGRRNAEPGDASPQIVNRFKDAEKWRAAVGKSREEIATKARHFFGDKEFDSEDSFSYLPAYRDDNGRIMSENGNDLGDNQSYRQSNFFSANRIDADMQRQVAKLPTKKEYMARRAREEAERAKGDK